MSTNSKANANTPKRKWLKTISGLLLLVLLAAGGYAAYRYFSPEAVVVKTARVRKGEFLISVKSTGDVRSSRSVILSVGNIPNPAIVKLAENGKLIRKGQVVVELDEATLEQTMLTRTTEARTVESEMVQLKATQRIQDEANSLSLMQADYNLERARLEASKAEVVSKIEGAKNRINVEVFQGEKKGVETVIDAAETSQAADLERLNRRKTKAERDVARTRTYLTQVKLYAPTDGIVSILPNFRSGGFGRTPPPFKEGDRVWAGAPIAEIPDLSEMHVKLSLDEVDRGRVQAGQEVRVRVDAVPDRDFQAEIEWISPVAEVIFRGFRNLEKQFPARARLSTMDDRLRPGMSATSEVVIRSEPGALLIPIAASFTQDGKPMVWVQRGNRFVPTEIEVGDRNDNDIWVTSGLRDGDVVALEDPEEAVKKARKI
ncbi:MAG: HlyD family efflux transporter periplasmic adaptor subunit, partial [Bryobacterales bacterium]|jgi:RND family efflux transporter MFP subunit|nr:HlyD family efflux transporter periplasmic adaptor subunit [Bryobacterales bacterium]